jgi:hypothetical protein
MQTQIKINKENKNILIKICKQKAIKENKMNKVNKISNKTNKKI